MEIWLSSEDTGAYGIDINTSLSTLLERLTREVVTVETGVMLRIGEKRKRERLYVLNNSPAHTHTLNIVRS